MEDNEEMLDRAIRHHQTVFKIKILLVVSRTINDLLDQSSIVRMHSLENQRDRRLDCFIISKNSAALLRPEDLSTWTVPANPACVTQLLRLGPVGFLGSTQRILGAFAVRDVVVGLDRSERIPAVGSLERP